MPGKPDTPRSWPQFILITSLYQLSQESKSANIECDIVCVKQTVQVVNVKIAPVFAISPIKCLL